MVAGDMVKITTFDGDGFTQDDKDLLSQLTFEVIFAEDYPLGRYCSLCLEKVFPAFPNIWFRESSLTVA